MNELVALGLSALVGYSVGCISFARIVVRRVTGGPVARFELVAPDGVGTFSSDMVSATAVRLQLGPRWGLLVGALDIAKGLVPTLAVRLAFPGEPYFLVAAAAVVAGHNWPITHRFHGGRGQSPIIGGMFAIDPLGTVVTNVAGMAFGYGVIRDAFLADGGGVILTLPWLWWRTGGDPWYVGYGIAVNAMYWIANIPELRQYFALRRGGHVKSPDDMVEIMRMDFPFMKKLDRRKKGPEAEDAQ